MWGGRCPVFHSISGETKANLYNLCTVIQQVSGRASFTLVSLRMVTRKVSAFEWVQWFQGFVLVCVCVWTANLADISILKGTVGNSLFLAMTFEVCLMLRSMSRVLKQHQRVISWWESEITEGSKTEVVQFWRQQRHESLLKSLQKNSFLLHYYHQLTHYQRLGNERSEVSLSAHPLSPLSGSLCRPREGDKR